MKLDDILTPASISEFNKLWERTNAVATNLMAEYQTSWKNMRKTYPALDGWVNAIENFQFDHATDTITLQSLRNDGLITEATKPGERTTSIATAYNFVSPRYLDAKHTNGKTSLEYAFTTLRFCVRREPLPEQPLFATSGLTNPHIIDCEVFETPYGFTNDIFDDMEKIHVVYLAGMSNGQFVIKPLYVGIGTGEAYGTGPKQRTGLGRFRFFRYDAKDNMHCEFVQPKVIDERNIPNALTIPSITHITESEAILVDGRNTGDASYMCLSDPCMQKDFTKWLAHHPENNLEIREIKITKKCQHLPCQSPEYPQVTTDIAEIRRLAEDWYRFHYVAWMHPESLSIGDALSLYYRQLPEYRRQQYEVYRVRPELVGQTGGGPSIPDVLKDQILRDKLPASVVRFLDNWLRPQVVKDLYAYGNHPELRLCLGLILCRLLFRSGIWLEAVRAAYDGNLYSVDFSLDRLLKDPFV